MRFTKRLLLGMVAVLCLMLCLAQTPLSAQAVSYPEGWYQDMKGWYYIDANGQRLTSTWAKDSRGWCYLDAQGYRAVNTWKKDSNGWCYLKADGFMASNQWVKDSVGWCYVGANGYMVYNKWVKDSVGWCHVGANGYMEYNKWIKDSVGWCHVGANGYMEYNKWVKDSVGWCHVGANGYMEYSKWVKDSVGWCYIGANGYMVTNKWVTDSKGWCYIGADGYAVTNQWKQDSVGWCYLDSEGSMVKNDWVTDNGNKYYLDSNGYMVTGWQTIGQHEYYFYSSGIMAANTTVEGQYLNAEGQLVKMLQVGFSRKDITPLMSVPMASYGDTSSRLCTGFLSYLYADCIAVTDAKDNTVLLISVDLYDSVIASDFVYAISQATGVPSDNILICATGTTCGPATSNRESQAITTYNTLLKENLIAVATAAMEDRKPAEQYIAGVETEGLNFVNRYIAADGRLLTDNTPDFGVPVVAHETEADHTLQLVKFVRAEGKDIILSNFQVQPIFASDDLSLYYGLVGEFRAELESALDCHVIYFSGASGNLAPYSRIADENTYADCRSHGKALAQYALLAEGNYRKMKLGEVQVVTDTYEASVNHSMDYEAVSAYGLVAAYDAAGMTPELYEELTSIGFNSIYHAQTALKNVKLGATKSIPITVIQIGEVGFVATPCQFFDTTGMYIKENSPFYMTIIATGANGDHGYVPTELAWENGGFQVDVSTYVSGTAEALANKYLDLLKSLDD